MAQIIEHSGIINKIENNYIQVAIFQQSACAACHAKGSCSAADSKEKIIEVESTDSSYTVGEKVIVFARQSIGLNAVILAFAIPFMLVLITLIVLSLFVTNELISGAISLFVLIPYYYILSAFNKKIKTKFKFDIKREIEL